MDNATHMNPNRTLFRIVAASTAIAFGTMVASLFAVKNTPGGLVFELTIPAVVAFVVAAVVAWFYWRMVEKLAITASTGAKPKFPPKFALFSGALLVIGFMSFLYPMKFIPAEKRSDVMIGLTLALACIAGVGFVMWHVRKFLESDQERTERERHHD